MENTGIDLHTGNDFEKLEFKHYATLSYKSHHQVALIRISLTFSLHPSISSITPDRFSKLYPSSSQSKWNCFKSYYHICGFVTINQVFTNTLTRLILKYVRYIDLDLSFNKIFHIYQMNRLFKMSTWVYVQMKKIEYDLITMVSELFFKALGLFHFFL